MTTTRSSCSIFHNFFHNFSHFSPMTDSSRALEGSRTGSRAGREQVGRQAGRLYTDYLSYIISCHAQSANYSQVTLALSTLSTPLLLLLLHFYSSPALLLLFYSSPVPLLLLRLCFSPTPLLRLCCSPTPLQLFCCASTAPLLRFSIYSLLPLLLLLYYSSSTPRQLLLGFSPCALLLHCSSSPAAATLLLPSCSSCCCSPIPLLLLPSCCFSAPLLLLSCSSIVSLRLFYCFYSVSSAVAALLLLLPLPWLSSCPFHDPSPSLVTTCPANNLSSCCACVCMGNWKILSQSRTVGLRSPVSGLLCSPPLCLCLFPFSFRVHFHDNSLCCSSSSTWGCCAFVYTWVLPFGFSSSGFVCLSRFLLTTPRVTLPPIGPASSRGSSTLFFI